MPIVLPSEKISRSKIIIYELKVRTYDSSSKRYPVEIDTIPIGRYSSHEKAENEMKNLIKPCPENQDEDYEVIHSFSVEEIGIDVPDRDSYYDELIYNDRGNLYGIVKNPKEHFSGTAPEDCKFKKGDFVEFSRGNKLEIGIVAGLPLSPDRVSNANAKAQKMYDEGTSFKDLGGNPYLVFCDQSDNWYAIYYGRNNIADIDLPEPRLFRPRFPVKARIRRRLHAKYKFETGIYTSLDTRTKGYAYGLELNRFMLNIFKEPHVVIFDDWSHLVISLVSYKILKGDPEKFDKSEINRMIKLIKANEEDLISGFRRMVEKYKNDKASLA